MSKSNEESQQQSQGVTLGTQGNQDITVPQGTKGSNKDREKDERKIPNQERSSASNSGNERKRE